MCLSCDTRSLKVKARSKLNLFSLSLQMHMMRKLFYIQNPITNIFHNVEVPHYKKLFVRDLTLLS
jgi:hypothetical protein